MHCLLIYKVDRVKQRNLATIKIKMFYRKYRGGDSNLTSQHVIKLIHTKLDQTDEKIEPRIITGISSFEEIEDKACFRHTP